MPPHADDHYRKLERLYATAPINDYYRPTLTISHGAARLRITVEPKMHHAAAAVHGSVYFKALDDAAYFAANSVVTDVLLLTASFTIFFMQPVRAGVIEARGTLTREEGRLFSAEAGLWDDAGRQIGRGSGTFVKSRIALGPEVGYA